MIELQLIDVTKIPKNNRIYNGTTKKYGITFGNTDYIIKFTKDEDMSVYTEYIASSFIRALGIACHEVRLGTYNGEIVAIIKDFTSNSNYVLHSFKDTKQSSEDTEIGDKEYTYDDVIYLIDKHLRMDAKSKLEAKHAFWRMFICDAIIGNRDRHWGNWGYLKNITTQQYIFAPLYDNGAGLYPGVNYKIHEYIDKSTRKKFMYDRIYTFPASLFKIKRPDRSYRSNYAEMFKDLRVNKLLAEEVRSIKQAFTHQKVYDIMCSICADLPLDNAYKRFYIEIVTLRYMCIILRIDFDKAYNLIESKLNKLV